MLAFCEGTVIRTLGPSPASGLASAAQSIDAPASGSGGAAPASGSVGVSQPANARKRVAATDRIRRAAVMMGLLFGGQAAQRAKV